MRGEQLSSVSLTLQGIAMDRRYAFVQRDSRSGFPWLTAREMPDLLLYRTVMEGEGSPNAKVSVIAPDGRTWPVASSELREVLETRSGRALFLLHDDRGSYDAGQVSLISRQTIARITEESGTPVDPGRFRPNLLIALEGGQPFDELNWVGHTVRIGDTARIAVTEVDYRCVMITLDPGTSQPSPAILKCVVKEHGRRAGVYASVLTAGEIRAGHAVTIEG